MTQKAKGLAIVCNGKIVKAYFGIPKAKVIESAQAYERAYEKAKGKFTRADVMVCFGEYEGLGVYKNITL